MVHGARFRAAIFDFDGVIADSIPLHFEAYRRLFADEGREFTLEEYRLRVNGKPRDESIRAILGDVEPARLRDLMARKERYVFQALERDGLRPIPGSLELAKAFRDRGLRTAVASSSRTARRFLEALSGADPALGRPAGLFDAVLEGDGVRAAKPDPEIYVAAAAAVEVPPAECVAFEDAVNGVQSARGAGLWVVAVATTEDPGALLRAGSHAVYPGFAEIDPDRILGIR
jgi:beta-phosphoglucomutase